MRIDKNFLVGSKTYHFGQEIRKRLSGYRLQLGFLNNRLWPCEKWEKLIWMALALVPYIQHELWLYVILASAVFFPGTVTKGRSYIFSAILWLGSGFLISLWSPEPGSSLRHWLMEMPVILGGIGAGRYLRRRPVGWGIIIAGSLPVIFLGIIQAIKGNPYPLEWVSQHRLPGVLSRITGTLGNPNVFGEYTSFLIPITLGLSLDGFKSGGKKHRASLSARACFNPHRYAPVIFIAYILVLYLTFSRTSWVATVVGVLVFFYLKKKEDLYKAGLLFIILLVLFQPLYLHKITALSQTVLTDSTVLYRFEIWEGTWNLIKKFPYIGVGSGNFLRYYSDFSEYRADHAHNQYLQIMAERGAVGLLVFFSLLTVVFSVPTPKNVDRGVKVALVTQMVAGLTESVWMSPLVLFFFWMGYGYLMEARDG